MQKPFMPGGDDTLTITATNTSQRVVLDPNSNVVRVINEGPNKAFINFGSSTVTSSTSRMVILPGTVEKFTKGTLTHAAAICLGADTAILRFTCGEGL